MKKIFIGFVLGYVTAKIIETETAKKVITWGKNQAEDYIGIAKSQIESAVSSKPTDTPNTEETTGEQFPEVS